MTGFVSSFNNEEKSIFNKFLKYYSKTWLQTKFIHFDLAYSENWTCRANNLCEAFHNTLTYAIEIAKQKLAIYLEQMKKIVKSYFTKSINNLVNINKSKDNNANTLSLVYNFIRKYHSTYHSTINFKGILQIDGELRDNLNIINIKLLETLFGIRLKENSNEETDKNNIKKYDFDEISPIIPEKKIAMKMNYIKQIQKLKILLML